MSCRPVRVRQTAKTQDLCFVTAYGGDLILTWCTVQSITSKSTLRPARHIKYLTDSAVKTPNHVLHHPSEQVRQNNHRMVWRISVELLYWPKTSKALLRSGRRWLGRWSAPAHVSAPRSRYWGYRCSAHRSHLQLRRRSRVAMIWSPAARRSSAPISFAAAPVGCAMQLADARVSERPLFSERDRWFESAFLHRRVCKPLVPGMRPDPTRGSRQALNVGWHLHLFARLDLNYLRRGDGHGRVDPDIACRPLRSGFGNRWIW